MSVSGHTRKNNLWRLYVLFALEESQSGSAHRWRSTNQMAPACCHLSFFFSYAKPDNTNWTTVFVFFIRVSNVPTVTVTPPGPTALVFHSVVFVPSWHSWYFAWFIFFVVLIELTPKIVMGKGLSRQCRHLQTLTWLEMTFVPPFLAFNVICSQKACRGQRFPRQWPASVSWLQ